MSTLAQVNIGQHFGSPFDASLGGKTIGDVVSNVIVPGSIALAGILLLVFLIFSGIALIRGAGSDNPEQAAKAKSAATTALIGFIIVTMAYLIIRLIEIFLGGGSFITNPGI